MSRWLPLFAVWFAMAALTVALRPAGAQQQKAPEVPAMPKALMKLPRTNITRSKFPTVDIHFHGGSLRAPQDYQKMITLMDETNLAVISNMDGGFGQSFDGAMKAGEPYKDRVIHFARLNYEGINEKGWSEKAATELDRCFKAGAQGLKVWKDVGLTLRNPDGTYIQADDSRFDPIWDMCARHNKPVMIHLSDSYGRFLPLGPENERYEAGLWRNDREGNYYETGHVAPEVIERARENIHRKHPKTHFINAHVAMLYHDMDKVTFSEISGPHSFRVGRQPAPGRRGVLATAFSIPRDLRRALRSSGAVALPYRSAVTRPLENLWHRAAGRCAAQGLLCQCSPPRA
jgi:predicted TIM-barrel fold metal-dependent hydrolase